MRHISSCLKNSDNYRVLYEVFQKKSGFRVNSFVFVTDEDEKEALSYKEFEIKNTSHLKIFFNEVSSNLQDIASNEIFWANGLLRSDYEQWIKLRFKSYKKILRISSKVSS